MSKENKVKINSTSNADFNSTKEAIAQTEAAVNKLHVDDDVVSKGKIPLAVRIYSLLCIILGGLTTLTLGLAVVAAVTLGIFTDIKLFESWDVTTQKFVLTCADAFVALVMSVMYVFLGVNIWKRKRRLAGRLALTMIGFAIAQLVLDVMLKGLGYQILVDLGEIALLVIIQSWLDPSLKEERQLQRKLSALEDKAASEDGTLGRDKTGEGYLTLNFFNIFWIFVICSILGLAIEMAVCPFLNGRIENRTGMLWGPFSPIYGVGAVLMTVALNRFWKKNPLIIFAISGFIGGFFEYLASWFFQFAFGILAWDYSDAFMNFDGRTDITHVICWGLLGLIWIRLLLPHMLSLVNKIPWNWRYGVTLTAASFMMVNILMTMMAFDCWFQRVDGAPLDTPVAEFFAEKYDDEFMGTHFATMSIDPSRSTRG